MTLTALFHALTALLGEMSPYILLGFLFSGILKAFVRPEWMTTHLSGNGFAASLKAALIGVPLPLCSCGVLPTAISLRRSGASTSATTAFLIATPQTGVDSIVATYSLLGPGFALLRPVAAFVTAVAGGTVMGRLTRGVPVASKIADVAPADDALPRGWRNKVALMLRYGFVDMVESVGKWLVIGLVIAALITVLVPSDLFVGLARYPLLAMVAVVIVAVPMYVCATGSIPIALSLMFKGLTPGVAFVLLMAGPAVNFASYTLLSRALGRRATLLYIALIAVGAIAIGMVVDYLLPAAWFVPRMTIVDDCCAAHPAGWWTTACSALLCVLLVYALGVKRFLQRPAAVSAPTATVFRIEGMTCVHCAGRVERAIAAVEGVTAVRVDLGHKTARVEGTYDRDALVARVAAAGYDVVGAAASGDAADDAPAKTV